MSICDFLKPKKQPPFSVTVTIPATKITVCYPYPKHGESRQDGITVVGKIVMGAYVPDMLVLGHEILHQMGRVNPGFVNPDEV